jgi:hypothetical protein
MPASKKPPRTGTGVLIVARALHPVQFSISLVHAVDGRQGGKGSVTGDPEVMRAAFRKGQVRLALDDGVGLDVALVGHTEGSPTAYFQIEASRRFVNQLVMS